MSDIIPQAPAQAANAPTAGIADAAPGKRSVLSRLASSVFKNPLVAGACAIGGFTSSFAVPLDIAADFSPVLSGRSPEMKYSAATSKAVQEGLGYKPKDLPNSATIEQRKAAIEEGLACTAGDLLGTIGGGTVVAAGLTALTGAGGAASGAVTVGRTAMAYQAAIATTAAADIAVTTASVVDGVRYLKETIATPAPTPGPELAMK